MAEGFAAGLASGLRGLPSALQYGLERRKRRRYDADMAGVLEGEGEIDYREAARVAGRNRDSDAMLAFSQLADARAARGRSRMQDDRQLMARRVLPYLAGGGDVAAVDRLVKQNPGIVGAMVGLPEHRKIAGVEAKTHPETGQQMWALRIANSETGTTGPMTARATAEPNDEVLWMTPNQVAQGLQPWLPAREKGGANWRAVSGRGDLLYNQETGETRDLPAMPEGAGEKPERGKWRGVTGRPDLMLNDLTGETRRLPQANEMMSAKDYEREYNRRLETLFPVGQFGDVEEVGALRQEADFIAGMVETESGGLISGFDVLPEAGRIISGDNDIREGLFSSDIEEQQAARSALLRGILVRMGYMAPERPPNRSTGEPAPEEESSESILQRLFGESEQEEAAATASAAAAPPPRNDATARRKERRGQPKPDATGALIDLLGAQPSGTGQSGRRRRQEERERRTRLNDLIL